MRIIGKSLIWLLALLTSLSSANICFADSVIIGDSYYEQRTDSDDYEAYLSSFGEGSAVSEVAAVFSESQISGGGIEITEEGLSWKGSGSSVVFRFSVREEGIYNLKLGYKNISDDNSKPISFDMELDGNTLFDAMNGVSLPRWFDSGVITEDSRGNDISVDPTVFDGDISEYVYVSDSHYDEPMQLYLTSGIHTVTLYGDVTDIILKNISLAPKRTYITYSEYMAEWEKNGIKRVDSFSKKLQGESADMISDADITPATDRNDVLTEPNSASAMKLNIIGGSTWKTGRKTVTWSIDVENEGLYRIAVKVRQNQKDGFISYRRLYINGEVPFEECNCVGFKYNSKWYLRQFDNEHGEPYYFYLKKGINTISLETVMGPLSQISKKVDAIISDLGDVYQEVLMVVGTKYDKYRVYDIPNEIPGVVEQIEASLEDVKAVRDEILATGVTLGSEMTVFDNICSLLQLYLRDTENITKKLSNLKSYLSDLSTWSYNTVEQPLEVDYIWISGSENKAPKINSGFLVKVKYEFLKLLASFRSDYGVVGDYGTSDREITVWLSTGREQLSILKKLSDADFTRKTGISVNLALMQTSLSQAVMAGKNPDVALAVENSIPIDLGYRNSICDLTEFEDYEEVAKSFMPNALTPFKIGDSVYAFPMTQNFEVMFIRDDIFSQLDLDAPTTWDDFYKILPVLQFNNYDIGISSGSSTFTTLLGQYGLSLYNSDADATDITSEKAGEVFTKWTEFYTKYDFPVSYNMYNRFRSGEMPIGISGYQLAAELEVLAPEISGKWSMYPLPGVVDENGNLSNGTSPLGAESGTCALILADGESRQDAWEYLKWFLSEKTQVSYGNNIEAQLGASARYTTANVLAIKQLGWSESESDFLLEQMAKSKPTPIVAGNYYVSRHLNNAFRAVVYNGDSPVHTLRQYSYKIDNEINRKLEEFAAKK